MANIAKIGSGFGVFILTILLCMISYSILTALFPVVNSATDENAIGDSWEGLIWFAQIIIWIVGIFIIPGVLYYEGITEQDEMPKIAKGGAGILMFIIGMLITVKLWFVAVAISNILASQTEILVILFWVGLLYNWAAAVIISPYYLIADARS